MGGQGGFKKKVLKKVAPGVATATQSPAAKGLVKKRPAPELAETVAESALPAKKRARKPKKEAPAHIPLEAVEPSQSDEPQKPLSKNAAALAKLRKDRKPKGFGASCGPNSTVVYLGHIPHGFYEEQMRGFFSQFGTVGRLRLARNKKTGRSKHFAFIEFEHKEVAEIVCKSMNGYLLYSKILVCKVLDPSEVHPKIWAAKPINPDKPIDWVAIERKRHNKPLMPEQREKRAQNQVERGLERKKKWQALGISYDFKLPVAEPTTEPASQAALAKTGAASKRPAEPACDAPVKKVKQALTSPKAAPADERAPAKKATPKKAATPAVGKAGKKAAKAV